MIKDVYSSSSLTFHCELVTSTDDQSSHQVVCVLVLSTLRAVMTTLCALPRALVYLL